MSRRFVMSVALIALAAMLIAIPAASAAPEAHPAAIRLKAATFSPGLGERPDVPPGVAIAGYAAGQQGDYLVQFAGPVQQAWKDAVAAAGGELLGYVPDYAFKVRMTSEVAAAVQSLDGVAWTGVFHPAYKLSPSIDAEASRLFRVRLERGADARSATSAIAAAGATIHRESDGVLLVSAASGTLETIARLLDVAWIESFAFHEKHNEFGAGVIVGANVANASGYDGSTQIAAVADTGIGDGTASGAHADIPASRVTAIQNFTTGDAFLCYDVFPDGARDVDSGHGTHTAVSVLGDGNSSGAGKGTAPAASLVFQAVEEYIETYGSCAGSPDGYYLVGIPDDLHNLYQPAYNAGARIHSNSWGSSVAGDYTQDSADTDDFVWDNPDMTITFSAGNSGADANSDGVIDNDSIGSPATAKNVITVGASENDRGGDYACDTGLGYTSKDAYQAGQTCSTMGGQNLLGTWGSRYGYVGPMANDPTAGNEEQMAGWSSRGPTDDGRIKPDIVAPGTWILSGYSNLHQEGYGDPVNPQNGVYQWDGWGMPVNADYKYMGGTSMSNPIAAGGATVVRDFYQKTDAHNASAALVKATLINSARDLLDENNDGADDNDYPIPNVHEGWGLIDIANATDGSHVYVDNVAGIATGATASHQYTVQTAGSPFRVSLVWSDFPSTAAAATNLVNDLDLVVTAPGGAEYRGNVFSGGWSTTGGLADGVNNVENVYVQSAAAGTWTVEVVGANVPQGPQPFALVVDGVFGTPPDAAPTVTLTNPADGATVSGTINVTATASDDDGVTQVEFFVDGTSIGVDTSAPYSVSWDTTTAGDGAHTVSATATDTIAQTATDTHSVTVDNAPANTAPTVSLVSPAEGTTVSGAAVPISIDATDAEDSAGTLTVEWNIDGGAWQSAAYNSTSARYEATWDTTVASNGGHTVNARATDSGGLTASDANGVTVSNAPPTTMHVGDLDSYASSSGKNWQATIEIAIHDAAEGAVSGATVSGSWGGGTTGSASCVTGATGTCQVMSASVPKKQGTVTFTVTNVTHASLSYTSGANHDVDGSSNGTSITAAKDDPGAPPPPPPPPPPPGAEMHVGDLDGSSAVARGNRWNATVTITVHDQTDAGLSGATVSGTWSNGTTGSGSCTTNSSGVCSITKNNIKNAASVRFTVESVAASGHSYTPADNHDPDGDSNGSVIVVASPQ